MELTKALKLRYYSGGPILEGQMTATTLTSREFDQNTDGAKKAAEQGPVFITDCGRPVHVLLTIEHYVRLTGKHISLAEALAQPGADFEFDPPRIGISKSARSTLR